MRCVLSKLARAVMLAAACAGAAARAEDRPRPAGAERRAQTSVPDSAHTLPPIVVRARRPQPEEILDRLPGQTSVVEFAPLRQRLFTTAEVLQDLPGLHVSDYGGLGTFSTISIRGSSSSQVSLYLDGVPLQRAGLGVVNLSELPFASIERVEVYRGSAPPEFAGASLGGVINLVTRRAPGTLPGRGLHAFTAGLSSFDTRRLGASHQLAFAGWTGMLVADLLQSQGDFSFHDDNGTPREPSDDKIVPRINNWLRSEEVMVEIGRPLPRRGDMRLVNQWMRRRQGVPGNPSDQSITADAGTTYNVTSLEARAPAVLRGRLQLQARAYHDWRRDTFADPEGKIGLGYQDNSDVTRAFGAHAGARIRLPILQQLGFDLEARDERFLPWHRYPLERGQPRARGPHQERTRFEAALEERLLVLGRLSLHAGSRLGREQDRFAGDLLAPNSHAPARSETRTWREPRFGARLRLTDGVHLEANSGQYHRTPGFLELFGDRGSVAGNSDLVAESGTNRDVGLQVEGASRGVSARFEVARFANRVDHLITFVLQSNRRFVARNIGAARLSGEEWSWRLAAASAGGPPRWALEGNYTHQNARDLGVDISYYAGKTLPQRPKHQIFQRLATRFGGFEFGYEYEHIGLNFLKRWNGEQVARRDLHGVDARFSRSGMSLQLGVRNLGDARAADVAGFPLPGRTFFATSGVRF